MNADVGYQKGALFDTGTLVVLAFSEKLDEQGVDHSLVAWWKDGKWPQLSQERLTVTSICRGKYLDQYQTLFAGMYGDVLVATKGAMRMEHLGQGADSPNRLRTIREIRAIGEHFVAVGMRRQVFRRHAAETSWEKIDAGVFVTDESEEIAGFISCDGFSESEIYAVGHRGEIWLFNGRNWSKIESPTNLILNCVRCMPDGEVYACGQAGVILRGRGDAWTQLNQEITTERLTSLAGLGNDVYFATESGVIMALNGGTFRTVDMLPGQPVSTGFLDSNGKSILSVGVKDIFLGNGENWVRLSDPEFKMAPRAQ